MANFCGEVWFCLWNMCVKNVIINTELSVYILCQQIVWSVRIMLAPKKRFDIVERELYLAGIGTFVKPISSFSIFSLIPWHPPTCLTPSTSPVPTQEFPWLPDWRLRLPVGPLNSATAWRYSDKDALEWPELGPIYTCTMLPGEHQTPCDKLNLRQIF